MSYSDYNDATKDENNSVIANLVKDAIGNVVLLDGPEMRTTEAIKKVNPDLPIDIVEGDFGTAVKQMLTVQEKNISETSVTDGNIFDFLGELVTERTSLLYLDTMAQFLTDEQSSVTIDSFERMAAGSFLALTFCRRQRRGGTATMRIGSLKARLTRRRVTFRETHVKKYNRVGGQAMIMAILQRV